MRLAGIALLAACHVYDPIDEIPHREFSGIAPAFHAILAEVSSQVRVYAVGEYHVTDKTRVRTTTLARFTHEILGLLEPRAHHLVIEAWADAGCGDGHSLHRQVSDATGRGSSTAKELQTLVIASHRLHLETHGLPVTCIEHGAMLDAHGQVDFYRLLELVTDKLGDAAREALAADPTRPVIVYGGALHNDLYPRWLLDGLSYAAPLSRELGGGVLEIDLVVPEVVLGVHLVQTEPWYPLLARAAPDRVLVWERGPSSYVVILPAQYEVAAPIASM
jgi:hypothetical protein